LLPWQSWGVGKTIDQGKIVRPEAFQAVGFPRLEGKNMSSEIAWATIEFPVNRIDEEIKKALEDYNVQFNGLTPIEEDDEPRVENVGGIFNLHLSEVNYGEYEDLEKLLVAKEIPFDRQTGTDWNVAPKLRVYRPNFNPYPNPGPLDSPHFNHIYPMDDDGVMIVSVDRVRELLPKSLFLPPEGENELDPWTVVEAAQALDAYLDKEFPLYQSLDGIVKEEEKQDFMAMRIKLRLLMNKREVKHD
jgi:hypothetical protein